MKQLLKKYILSIPIVYRYYCFKNTIINKVTLYDYITHRMCLKLWGAKDKVYWPVHKNSEIACPNNIYVGVNANPGTRPGCYIQGNGGIYVGNYVQFASNIGIISANHDLNDQALHVNNPVIIGSYSWIGQGALIMPGVKLGPRVIVGAGSVVTKSFPNGWCVVAGNPARIIKELDPKSFVFPQQKYRMNGFLTESEFERLILSKQHKIKEMKELAEEIDVVK